MLRLFQSFLASMQAGFRRIAKRTKNEMTVEDLHNDAWVMALDIGDRRGKPIDFGDPVDQDLVMAALYVQKVKRGDWKMRCAVRIDQEPENEDGDSVKVIDTLAATESSDPLVSLLAKESAISADALLKNSYSQATAYVVTFNNLGHDRRRLCDHLVITDGTLARRVTYAANSVRVQPSMFDSMERIADDFMPLPGKLFAVNLSEAFDQGQLAWDFEEAA